MALVAFLRGVNVGGHRRFRPAVLAAHLRRFDVVNVGAAGTFVVRGRIGPSALRVELARRLPFETDIMICRGADVLRLVSSNPLAGERSAPDIVPFVTVLAKRCRPSSPLPQQFPASGRWGLRIAGQDGPFVFGVYRREMRAIAHLSQIDRLFGVPATTRNWNTIETIARLLERSSPPATRDLTAEERRKRRQAVRG
jgi:uncharacterized protein (DUF1697 family)